MQYQGKYFVVCEFDEASKNPQTVTVTWLALLQ